MPVPRNFSLTWRNASCATSGRKWGRTTPIPTNPPFEKAPSATPPPSTYSSRACRCPSTECSSQADEFQFPAPLYEFDPTLLVDEVDALGTVDLGDPRQLYAS